MERFPVKDKTKKRPTMFFLSNIAGRIFQKVFPLQVLPPRYYSNLWMTSPERSFGSNHVVLGGMMFPVSAISINCFIETG